MSEDFTDRQLLGARFEHVDLTGASLERVDFTGATFTMVDLCDATIRAADVSGLRLLGVEGEEMTISGEFQRLVVNGIDVLPLVEAELTRRIPERALMNPTDADGFRAAWDALERLWGETVARARTLDPALLHEQVADEWSFVETLRHLVFATESWVGRALRGDPAPWHPLSLPWNEMPDTDGVPRDRTARPSLDEVLALREDRAAMVRAVMADLTDEQLAGGTTPVEGPGWPRAQTFPVREVLWIILNEEWWHRQYAERDLSLLGAGPAASGAAEVSSS